MVTGVSLKLRALAVTAAVLLIAGQSFAAEEASFHEEGRILRPEATAHLVELIQNPKLRNELSTEPAAFQKIAEVLNEKAQKEIVEYESAVKSKDVEAIRKAEESLHKRFWETMEEGQVRDALHGKTAGEVAHDFGGFLLKASEKVGATDKALGEQYKASAEHILEAQRTSRQRVELVRAADRFLESDSKLKEPSFGGQVQALLRSNNPPSTEALEAFSRLLGDTYTAAERGIGNRGTLSAEEMKMIRHQLDYETWSQDPKNMQERFEVLGSILRGDGAAEALKGHDALFFAPTQAVRERMIEKASELGVLDKLKEEVKKELTKSLGHAPSDQEVVDHLSLRDLESRIAEKLGPGALAEFKKELDSIHSKGLLKAMLKIVREDPEGWRAKVKALKELFRKPKPEDRPRRNSCVSSKALKTVGAAGFAALIVAALPGQANAEVRTALLDVNKFAAGGADPIVETPANLRSRAGGTSAPTGPATHDGVRGDLE